jgi:formylglycine-generating enzyme required for sulfatase activity
MHRLMSRTLTGCFFILAVSLCQHPCHAGKGNDDALLRAVSFYASFDEEVRGDFGRGNLLPKTRFDHPTKKGEYVYEDGYRREAFRINPGGGVHGGALAGVDVLPRRGRMFFPADGNLAFNKTGWNGAVSMWLNTDPNTMLKTRYCDPIQITEKRAGDGGLWIDFPDVKPRDLRLGAFRALAAGEKQIPEANPRAPLIRVKDVGFKSGDWHHVVMTWKNVDSGKQNANVALYIDGKRIGRLQKRNIAMKWNLERTGIYVAVSYIGLLDELALFNRPLSKKEISRLLTNPGVLTSLKNRARVNESRQNSLKRMRELSDRVSLARDKAPESEEVNNLRDELHRFLRTAAGRVELEALLALLLRLPATGGRAPSAPEFPFDAAVARKYQHAYAKWTGLPVALVNRVGMTLTLIPPGTFLMGSPANEPGHAESPYDETHHPVRLTRPFYLSKYETTLGQFSRFVKQVGYVTDGERNGGGHAHDEKAVWKHRPGTSWRKPGFAGPFELMDEQPVVHVSHADAGAFCTWLGKQQIISTSAKPQASDERLAKYRLPTEAEWEWSCRAGSSSRYWWGAELAKTGDVSNVGDRTLKRVHPQWPRKTMPMDDGHAFVAPVGSYRANGFGLHDMLGNVWEFCATRYGAFPKELDVDPSDLSAKRGFAVRGGGWSNHPNDARSATRNTDPPNFCHSNLGFRVALHLPPRNVSRVIEPGKMPYRVHVVETYETDIEKRWWLRGKVETKDVPPSRSQSVPNLRVSRASETLTFDRKMGDRSESLKGVVFNPVPGPPMGKNTRLSFRYYLEGTDTIRVQIYSLSNNYHRHLVLTGLPKGKWQSATVDMNAARRPDGSGGPLSEDERIDDIQFYINPDAELLIDDILLYEAAEENESRPFPRRVMFTGWFDTGKQGKEWPGDFEIVLHEKPLTWDAARSVVDPKTGKPHIRVHMRGERTLSEKTRLRFRYRLRGTGGVSVSLAKSDGSLKLMTAVKNPQRGRWTETSIDFELPRNNDGSPVIADEINFLVDKNAELLIDDLLLYEPYDKPCGK